MKSIADKLLGHPYMAKCRVGRTDFIKIPREIITLSYEWE